MVWRVCGQDVTRAWPGHDHDVSKMCICSIQNVNKPIARVWVRLPNFSLKIKNQHFQFISSKILIFDLFPHKYYE